ncbi:serine/threonine protein kinase [Nocardia nova]|uniref:non-specific serine/threonine protein kinase n=2 Tax=Nocardia TaxID=1817 RepID=A0A2T2YQA1_9NOCA|nr:serine/threonine protein kinase [Nocardia nova]
MGTVYLARHPRLPRSVALKLLRREVSSDAELRRRFEQEASVVAKLEHPNIVGIYDRGVHDGHLWIAMQYVRGTDASHLDFRTVTGEHAARIIADIAAALDYAHAHGVLHRDIKPANILLAAADAGRAEHAVLTDFGIARLLDSTTKVTATGTFTATLAFAAPEQLSGQPLDHRADQYSLACTLFALLTGRSPFAADNPGQVVAGHLGAPVPSIHQLRPDLPPQLDAVLARAMAKDRDRRFRSCGELASAVHTVIAQRSAGVRSPAPETVILPDHSLPPAQWHQPAPPYAPGPPRPAWPPHNVAPEQSSPWRRWRGRTIAVSAAAIAAVLAIGLVVWHGSGQQDSASGSDGSSTRDKPWNPPEQKIADAFPKLVSSRPYGTSWGGGYCEGPYTGTDPYVDCSQNANVPWFTIYDYGSIQKVNANLVFATGVQMRVPHAGCAGIPLLHEASSPVDGGPAAVLIATFPDDPSRSGYKIEMLWHNHTKDDIINQFWNIAPICN